MECGEIWKEKLGGREQVCSARSEPQIPPDKVPISKKKTFLCVMIRPEICIASSFLLNAIMQCCYTTVVLYQTRDKYTNTVRFL